jgi:L-histidine N-alpha-methyltransferase
VASSIGEHLSSPPPGMSVQQQPDPSRSPSTPKSALDAETDSRLKQIWQRAYSAGSKDDLRDLYADWVATYDQDHEKVGFFGHTAAARVLARYQPYIDVVSVLDAGAGTGAAGVALAEEGFRNVTAIDLSPAMLEKASAKGCYRSAHVVDLGEPIDIFPGDHFGAAILVGVFSYGQAPAHALEEIVRLVKPGGVVVFTMRTDFFEQDEMGVRSKMEELEQAHAWRLLELGEPMPYLPNKDPSALFRVWAYRVLDSKQPFVDEAFASAARAAFVEGGGPVKRIDHAFIWNSMASRLYDAYTEEPDYYLTDTEVSILAANGPEIVGDGRLIVELGCGSAHKIRHLLGVATAGDKITYTPVDLSQGALEATMRDVQEEFGERVEVDPRCAHYVDALATIPVEHPKLIVWFGSSVGNIETVEGTVEFLRTLRDRMGPQDRLVFGCDLHKDAEILRRAYEAGPVNRSFFLNMVRRMNNELGANFDLQAFRQQSPYEPEPEWQGLQARCVQFHLVTDRPQRIWFSRLHMEAAMEAGDAIQVGTSRKYEPAQIARLGELAGLKLTRQWFDEKRWFALSELVPAPQGEGRG